jgi:hypothetical protein
MKLFEVYSNVYGNGKTIFLVCSRDRPIEALRTEPETDVAVNLILRYRTSRFIRWSFWISRMYCIETCCAGDGVTGHELLGSLWSGNKAMIMNAFKAGRIVSCVCLQCNVIIRLEGTTHVLSFSRIFTNSRIPSGQNKYQRQIFQSVLKRSNRYKKCFQSIL